MTEVSLSTPEVLLGAWVGVMRRVSAIKKGRNERFGWQSRYAWQNDIDGALGELAVAKVLDRFWSGTVGRVDALDVGTLEVRATFHERHPHLFIHKTDHPDKRVILVTGAAPRLTLRGWAFARDGQHERYWRTDTGCPCYWLPASKLKPMETLETES